MSPSALKRLLVHGSDDSACRLLCMRAGTWTKLEEATIREAVREIQPAVLEGGPRAR